MRWILSIELILVAATGFSLQASTTTTSSRGNFGVFRRRLRDDLAAPAIGSSTNTGSSGASPRRWFRRKRILASSPDTQESQHQNACDDTSILLQPHSISIDENNHDAKTVLMADQQQPQPVHLMQQQEPMENTDDDNNTTATTTTLQVHTYKDTSSFQTYKGLNTSLRKFQSYLLYLRKSPVDPSLIETTTTATIEPFDRKFYKQLWESGRLITNRTEWLSSSSSLSPSSPTGTSTTTAIRTTSTTARFPELLQLYTDRVWFFAQDDSDHDTIRSWLETGDYAADWHMLTAVRLRPLPLHQQIATLKRFLEWFKSEYPYFYDRCEHCGASKREDDKRNVNNANCNTEQVGNDDEEEQQNQTFIGYIHSNALEFVGKAIRTELYQCHVCHQFTRFPRYNSVRHVLSHKRGRCGEYSMVLYRILQFLGHDARWVVDWADHVWSEVHLDDRWIHLDPCEAAVDEKLLYQNWGKRQVYIMAFYLPPTRQFSLNDNYQQHYHYRHALVEDVTQHYTTESWERICSMRDETEEQVKSAILNATKTLEDKLGILSSSLSPSHQRNTTETVVTAGR